MKLAPCNSSQAVVGSLLHKAPCLAHSAITIGECTHLAILMNVPVGIVQIPCLGSITEVAVRVVDHTPAKRFLLSAHLLLSAYFLPSFLTSTCTNPILQYLVNSTTGAGS